MTRFAPCCAALLAGLATPALGQAPDSTARFQAEANTQVSILVPPGDYRLDGVVQPPPGRLWEMTGTRFSGPGLLADAGDWSPFLARLGKAWVKNDVEPGNAFGTVTALTIGVSGAVASYEKAAGYDFVLTADPSTYTGSGTAMADLAAKDAVGRQMTAVIREGNRSGRAFGSASMGVVSKGSDGAAAAAEFDISNDGSDQPLSGQPTSKTGVGIVALGHTRATVALIVVPGTTQFHDGVLIRQEAVADTAIRVTASGSLTENTFAVTPAGDVTGRSLAVRGHIGVAGPRPPAVSAGTLRPGSSDLRGAVTLAAGMEEVRLTFADAFATAPFCVVSGSDTAGLAAVTSVTPVAVTLTRAGAGGKTITWHCIE